MECPGVPIIPIFTENIREAYCTMSIGRDIWRALYERTRLPMVPIYGGFPVRLTTHVGAPIRLRRDETAEGLAVRVQEAMQTMIATHQRGEDMGQLLLSRVYDQYLLEDKLV